MPRRMRVPGRLLTSVVLLAGILALSPGSGSAGGGKGCPDGRLCVWSDPNYEGQKLVLKRRQLSNRLANQMNDQASSLKLRKSGTAVLFEDVDGEGIGWCFSGPRDQQSDLANLGFDDQASSSRIHRGQVSC